MSAKVEIKVKSVKGFCSAGYKEGDTIIFCDPNLTPVDGKPICIYAFGGISPYLTAFGRKTEDTDWINSLKELQCPDSANTVVFSFERK